MALGCYEDAHDRHKRLSMQEAPDFLAVHTKTFAVTRIRLTILTPCKNTPSVLLSNQGTFDFAVWANSLRPACRLRCESVGSFRAGRTFMEWLQNQSNAHRDRVIRPYDILSVSVWSKSVVRRY